MRSYIGGPFDGKQFSTKYDDLPVIALEYPDIQDGKLVRMVAYYELKCGMRTYRNSKPFPTPPEVNHGQE